MVDPTLPIVAGIIALVLIVGIIADICIEHSERKERHRGYRRY